MKKTLAFISTVYIFLFVCGSVFAIGEKTISLGGGATWTSAEKRTGITEVKLLRPNPVLILSSMTVSSEIPSLDLCISFDEKETGLFKDSAGHYRLTSPPDVECADRAFARAGMGAALFGRSGMEKNMGPIIIQPVSRNAMFAPGGRMRDFTIEFWLYPLNMENGEQVLSWVAEMPVNGKYVIQRINSSISKNRLIWSFSKFFMSASGSGFLDIEFSGDSHVVPKMWSHHIVRFDSDTGLIEYLVDGKSESIVYATSTGRESRDVYTPIAGNGGAFLLGEKFSGLIDEMRIYSAYTERRSIQKYAPSGGRIETKPVDLGDVSSGVVKVNVSGGRTSIRDNSVKNEFNENGRFRYDDDSEMNFFVRASDNPYQLNNCKWTSFTPGANIAGITGRYVQLAVDFYPSSDGEGSPYLDEINIVFIPGEPPLPPRNLIAVASDGAVTLSWKHSPNANMEDGHSGYLVYYSSVRGELFGEDAALGASPVDVGIKNKVNITGLTNGTLYYFRVASYDLASGYNIGVFSAEVTARPLTGLP
ncbi:MAG: fibronectin type III domain-containing protein [Treponema sp.]|nr:fibronectin type III domain-containing protein [Treponema sp.]